jgi:hypothetical protein
VLNPDFPNPKLHTRYVKELDIVHRKNQESNAELRAMLNQSEQAKKPTIYYTPYTIHHTPFNTCATALAFSNTAMPDARAGSSRFMQRLDA